MDERVPVIAIVGSSGFLQAEAVNSVLQSFGGDEDAVAPARFDGGNADLVTVLDEVRTVSLLSDHRVVVVDDADPFVSANRETLERYCARPADTGTLILLCKSLPKTTRLYKAVQKVGRVMTLDPPKGRAIAGWASQRARTVYGKRLAATDAQRIVERVGDSLDMIDAELAKLTVYVGQADSITEKDIAALTGQHREEKIFAVIDAIAVGDAQTALEHWRKVFASNRAAPFLAIGGLAFGVRRLHEARVAFEQGAPGQQLARMLFTDPATAERRVKRFTAQQLEAQQKDLLHADLSVKTGAATVEPAIEAFIVKHAVGAGHQRKAV